MSNGMRLDGDQLRAMPLHMQEQVGVAIASQIAKSCPVAGCPERRETEMTLQKAIQMLKTEYERAQGLDFVYNPLAYALYKVWKMANERNV